MNRGRIKISYIIELFALAIIIAVILLVIRSRAEINTNSAVAPQEQQTNESTDAQPNQSAALPDDDQDGLTNEEEVALGTNPKLADSDNDGLIDYDEVKVYKSDPLNPDTDGDGNQDGTEVQNGYSPLDDSKLLDLNREAQQFNQ